MTAKTIKFQVVQTFSVDVEEPDPSIAEETALWALEHLLELQTPYRFNVESITRVQDPGTPS